MTILNRENEPRAHFSELLELKRQTTYLIQSLLGLGSSWEVSSILMKLFINFRKPLSKIARNQRTDKRITKAFFFTKFNRKCTLKVYISILIGYWISNPFFVTIHPFYIILSYILNQFRCIKTLNWIT